MADSLLKVLAFNDEVKAVAMVLQTQSQKRNADTTLGVLQQQHLVVQSSEHNY